jgi:transposase
LAAAIEQLNDLRRRLAAARARLRGAAEIDLQVAQIPERYKVTRYVKVARVVREEHSFKQSRRGRPGPDTAYRKITRRRFDIEWTLDAQAIAYDQKSDGMYPLLCNDPSLSPAQVLTAHKGQPCIEKRFEQLKSVHEIAPVFLKNEARIEALFTLYFLALLVQALIERELRQGMQAANIDQLPLYPEARACRAAHHRTHPAAIQPHRARVGVGQWRGHPSLPARTHRTPAPGPRLAGSARLSLSRQALKPPSAAAEIRVY